MDSKKSDEEIGKRLESIMQATNWFSDPKVKVENELFFYQERPTNLKSGHATTTVYTITGYVERLTMRVTILVSLDGNHVQIPNARVYKSNIINPTSNPNHREAFSTDIGHHCSISKGVEAALKILVEICWENLENKSFTLPSNRRFMYLE